MTMKAVFRIESSTHPRAWGFSLIGERDGVIMSQTGPLARPSFRSSVISGEPSAWGRGISPDCSRWHSMLNVSANTNSGAAREPSASVDSAHFSSRPESTRAETGTDASTTSVTSGLHHAHARWWQVERGRLTPPCGRERLAAITPIDGRAAIRSNSQEFLHGLTLRRRARGKLVSHILGNASDGDLHRHEIIMPS